MLGIENDKGLGDTLKRTFSSLGIDKVAEKVAEVVTGDSDCGCGQRAEFLNNLFPYSTTEHKVVEINGEKIRLMN